MVKVIPVIFKSGEDGKILLLVPAVNDWMTTEKLFIFSGVVFVLSFIITNIVIITAFSKKVTIWILRLLRTEIPKLENCAAPLRK